MMKIKLFKIFHVDPLELFNFYYILLGKKKGFSF